MKKQFLLTLALASLTVLLVAQSPPPPPTPTIKGNEKQDLSASEQHNSKYSPTPIVSPIEHNESAKDKDKENSQGSTNRRIDVLALIVAAATVAQFVAAMIQAGIMKRGLKATELAAEAARKSAEASTQALQESRQALQLTERAMIRIENVTLRKVSESNQVINKATAVNFNLKNFGRTEARAVRITGKLVAGEKEQSLADLTEIIIPPQGHNVPTSRTLGAWLEDSEIEAIDRGKVALCYQIKVTYKDVFNKGYSYEASGVWSAGYGRFHIRTDNETVI